MLLRLSSWKEFKDYGMFDTELRANHFHRNMTMEEDHVQVEQDIARLFSILPGARRPGPDLPGCPTCATAFESRRWRSSTIGRRPLAMRGLNINTNMRLVFV